ncbi:MAG: hypothetical protein RL328_2869, partial [Acidobacteriota bacterium]
TFNHAALTLMISVGHRTGLFDAMAAMESATIAEIAARAQLNERYVREWLGAMVTGGAIEVDPATERYVLPAAHAASLTRAAGPDNMARFSQYIAELGRIEDDIVQCFREGGGVSYAKYPRFHDIMAEGSVEFVAQALESAVLPLIPGIQQQLAQGLRVVDVGCGRGLSMIRLAERFPNSHFEGVDFSQEAIRYAQSQAQMLRLENVVFHAQEATQPLPEASYDLITAFDAIHDQGRPLDVLRNICQALKPDGVFLMQEIRGSSHHHGDIGHPLGTMLYTISCMHCMTVSLAQGGEGLGAMWGEERTRDYLTRAGFRSIERHELPHDIQNYWYVVRK